MSLTCVIFPHSSPFLTVSFQTELAIDTNATGSDTQASAKPGAKSLQGKDGTSGGSGGDV